MSDNNNNDLQLIQKQIASRLGNNIREHIIKDNHYFFKNKDDYCDYVIRYFKQDVQEDKNFFTKLYNFANNQDKPQIQNWIENFKKDPSLLDKAISDPKIVDYIPSYVGIHLITSYRDWVNEVNRKNAKDKLVRMLERTYYTTFDALSLNEILAKNNCFTREDIDKFFDKMLTDNKFCKKLLINNFKLQFFANEPKVINLNTMLTNKHDIYVVFDLSDSDILNLFEFMADIVVNDDVIETAINNFDEDYLEDFIKTNKYTNINNIDIEIGESVPLHPELFHILTHTDQFLPILYINGNVLIGEQVQDKLNGRIHHDTLKELYLKDMSYHKNDIIHKSKEEWEKINSEESWKIPDVRAVKEINGTAVVILYGDDNFNVAAKAISQKLDNGKVFAMSDSTKGLSRLARHKRLKKLV